MQPEQLLRFGPYRLTPRTGQLWQGKQEVKVTPKATAVLRSLLERPGQVVTKEELLAAAWPDAVVSDAALTTCIQELRQALHDPARKPRYIETMHRRGYRFIATVTAAPVPPSTFKVQRSQSPIPNPCGGSRSRTHPTAPLVSKSIDRRAATGLRDGRAGDRQDDAY